jgi:hypothetical protein
MSRKSGIRRQETWRPGLTGGASMLKEGASPGLCFRIELERTALSAKGPCSK